MTIDLSKEHEIRRLHDVEKWKRGTIVAELGVHPDVVDRVLDRGAERPLLVAPKPRIIDPYAAFIDETLKSHPRLRATRLFDMIRMRGYEGGIAQVRRHVAEVRPIPRGEVYLRSERLIGEQAQIDWAHVGSLAVTGGTRPLWVFVMLLAYSRAVWAELVYDLTVESLRRSLVRAAKFFGGVTRQWLFDNPKTVVLARHGDAVRYHPGLLEISGALRVQPRLCRPRRPTDKGGVERAVRYFRDRFFAARPIASIEDGNRQLLDFIRDIADVRPHPRFRDRTVAEVFAEEKDRLLSLPLTLPETDLVAPANVDTTAFVRFGTNLYSLPPRYARSTVTLVASDSEVRLLDAADVIAKHERSWGKHQRIEDPEHRRELLEQKRAGRIPKTKDRLLAQIAGIDALYTRWVDVGRNVGLMTARTGKLLDLYGAEVLAKAVSEVLARGLHDPGALALCCEQARRRAGAPIPALLELGPHVPDCDVIPHDLAAYDKKRSAS
ncbi:MAG TPA: IS21 family transposase [Casimicrobiaceae bacterium]|nr:IS21 family transposase [Candidatus Limnocylindria bacterium]HVR92524.1 IS21 family transposase [Casimicrobiaceae bacterium]